MQNNSDSGIIYSGGDNKLVKIGEIDFGDNKAVSELIENFCKNNAYSYIENVLILSPTGNFYNVTGNKFSVETSLIGEDNLKGSICVHNHPVSGNEIMGNSFSDYDLAFTAEYKLGKQYLISGERKNAFEYTGNLGYDEMIDEYNNAFNIVRNIAWDTGIEIYAEEQQVMEKLNEILEGFTFYENF